MSSSSSWPPDLKAWVQECLSKATPSNKSKVNAELKQMLFHAHKDGSINTTDWTKVELESLRNQNLRSVPIPVLPRQSIPVVIPPPAIVSSYTPVQTVTPSNANGSAKAGKKKKRKQNDIQPDSSSSSSFPTAYTFSSPADAAALARRAARFSQRSSSHSPAPQGVGMWFDGNGGDDEMDGGGGISVSPKVGKKRLKGKGGLGYEGVEVVEVDPNVLDWDRHTIRGTNQKLEKSYLRLTSEPSPADIRPLSVLQKTLQLLKRRWKEDHNYGYALDQFKSMRQDLTVQRIKNEFTVEVYEIHGRIALEANDLGEYNQCQTMLRQLYELGIKGHPQEFLSYRIIYLLHTRNRSDMASLLAQLTPNEKADTGVHHALQVHAALATSNYVRFFRLFNTAPNMSGYIMDHFVERERVTALGIMCKGYITLPLPYLTSILSFDSDSDTDKFLSEHGMALYTNYDPAVETAHASNPWKPIKAPPPLPFHERLWDCKKSQAACTAAAARYRVVDLKGQVD